MASRRRRDRRVRREREPRPMRLRSIDELFDVPSFQAEHDPRRQADLPAADPREPSE